MSVGTPATRIGSEYPLGFVTQSTLGTPVTVPASAGNWINQTAHSLSYVTGSHMIKTALGTRAAEQESAQGEIHLEGGFEANLRTSTIRTLIEALLGTGNTSGTPPVDTISVSRPKLLTLEDNWANESHQYADCMLNQATFSCQNHMEWKAAFTVLGGLQTLITSATPTFNSSDPTLAWADVVSITGLSAIASQISQFSFTINNGIKQDFGAGQHAATAVVGGEFSITGSFVVRYDSAAAATVDADYVANADLGPTVLTIGATGTQATATAAVSSGAVTSVTVTAGGSGYTTGATVGFSGGGGSGATGTVQVANGIVTGVTVTAGGTGYTTPPTVTISAPEGNQHVITFPNITLMTAAVQKPLDDFIRLSCTFGVKGAQGFQWAMPG
jgi:hypothetical protein